MSLVMRLETAAAKFDWQARSSVDKRAPAYDFHADDMRNLLQEAATRIKLLEHVVFTSSRCSETSFGDFW